MYDGFVTNKLKYGEWQQVGVSYNYETGDAKLWRNGEGFFEENIGIHNQAMSGFLRIGHALHGTSGL